MATIASKLLGQLGKAVQVTTEKKDLFISLPELTKWVETYNTKMLARGLGDNVIELFKGDGAVDPDKIKDAFEAYNSIYLYNKERPALLRNTKTGISLYDPNQSTLDIKTQVRSADRFGYRGRGEEQNKFDTDQAKAILEHVQKKEISGVSDN